jgi:hypothetical protein
MMAVDQLVDLMSESHRSHLLQQSTISKYANGHAAASQPSDEEGHATAEEAGPLADAKMPPSGTLMVMAPVCLQSSPGCN